LVTSAYIDEHASSGDLIVWRPLPSLGVFSFERPDIVPEIVPVYVILGIIIGTLLVWLFVRVKSWFLWKLWFFIAVLLCLYVSFFAFLDSWLAFGFALVLSFLKIFRPFVVVHNFTELFVYAGLAAIFVPILNVFSVFVVLVLIMVYDAYAVWRSEHMIALAKWQMRAKLFAGLLIPYKIPSLSRKSVSKKVKTALLGGGDVAFPLFFAGVVMNTFGFWQAVFVSLCASIALFLLMTFGKRDKFYPAMPFIGVGCFVGYGVVFVLNMFV